ncbi:arsenate reductase (glutaredoxin) [Paraglaciecola sp. L1A13]|uniref:arsenate reductase (glutaredoxin) n=1 Tax=Paraglaciecola sp. L1A13 TaxID=2686359 RepID=UPI00131E6245|nr:arsenate reductase (glutaredoxin) [Paraglaciecola sp. L1A13]
MSQLTILHNPRCSKSRETLKILQDNGQQPNIIEYLKNPPSEDELQSILLMLGMLDPRSLMRTKEAEYKALNLDSDNISPDELLRVMHVTPKLIERPIVIKGPLTSVDSLAVIGRPPENVLKLL